MTREQAFDVLKDTVKGLKEVLDQLFSKHDTVSQEQLEKALVSKMASGSRHNVRTGRIDPDNWYRRVRAHVGR
jgi:hypothetical protein